MIPCNFRNLPGAPSAEKHRGAPYVLLHSPTAVSQFLRARSILPCHSTPTLSQALKHHCIHLYSLHAPVGVQAYLNSLQALRYTASL